MTELEKNLVYFLNYCVGIFIFFQIKIQFESIYFIINLADIFALCGLALVGLRVFMLKETIDYRIPYTGLFLILSAIAMGFSLCVGLIKFGSNSWAFLKFTGWFVVLGYFCLASLFMRTFGLKGLWSLSRVMGFTLCSIIIAKSIVFYLLIYKFLPGFEIRDFPEYWVGFSTNRNSFCFQQLMLLCVFIPYRKDLFLSCKNNLFISIFMFGIFISSSRSGQLSLLFLLIAFYFLNKISFKRFFLLIFQSGFFILIFLFLPEIIEKFLRCDSVNFRHSLGSASPEFYYSNPESNQERIYSLIEGIKLWFRNPIFGGGLGSFVDAQKSTFHEFLITHHKLGFLVIHNTLIWLLAEFGLVGVSVFFVYGANVVHYAYMAIIRRYRKKNLTQMDATLVGIVLVFLLFSLIHEILYQRLFWFVFGLAISTKLKTKASN